MRPIIYQLVVRYFGNTNTTNQTDGGIHINGCGKFNDISKGAIAELKKLGVTHLWLTGVIRQATLTDNPEFGLPADDSDIVKGLAGSLFAVHDYYDVSPDYASSPPQRMIEFESLIRRIHDGGLSVMMDLIPNHVSRAYNAHIYPDEDLGLGDDQSQFFANENHFFYLVDPPHQQLRLSKPESWNPPGVLFDGQFAPEDGTPGHAPKVTGNNVTSTTPGSTDWYETVKLNYGFNFVTGKGYYDPQPRTWTSMDRVVAYWQNKGVDGFRCDFAHYVPKEAWSFLIDRARRRRPAFFVAEAYPYAGSSDPVHTLAELIDAGFDAVYHYTAYNAAKGVYTDGNIDAYEQEQLRTPPDLRPHFVLYLENHDERRIASPIVRGSGPGASGFGSAYVAYQLAPLHFLSGNGPVLIFNGQEVGETGAGVAGFAGENGRTTLFDYWAMPEFVKWVNGHLYDGGSLTSTQRALRSFYADLLHLCQDDSIGGDGFWSLRYFDNAGRFSDCPDPIHVFARFRPGSGRCMLVVANLHPGQAISGQIRLPLELSEAIGLPARLAIHLVLDRFGSGTTRVGTYTREAMDEIGFHIAIPNQTSHVYRLESIAP
jgi:glycosidase